MPSSYTTSNRFEKPGILEQDGTWGTTLNTDYDLIDSAISGYTSIALADANYSLTVASGAADQARQAALNFTGSLTATRTITVPAVSKLRVITNNATQSLTFTTGSGTTVTLVSGRGAWVACDGTNMLVVSSNTTDATTLNGQLATYYTNASNLASGTVPAARLTSGTTSVAGTVQLLDSVASTSTALAAVPNSVKTAYDAAVAAQSTANTGVANAASAQTTANTANSTANTAVSNAATAQSTANTAVAGVNAAVYLRRIVAWGKVNTATGVLVGAYNCTYGGKVGTGDVRITLGTAVTNFNNTVVLTGAVGLSYFAVNAIMVTSNSLQLSAVLSTTHAPAEAVISFEVIDGGA